MSEERLIRRRVFDHPDPECVAVLTVWEWSNGFEDRIEIGPEKKKWAHLYDTELEAINSHERGVDGFEEIAAEQG